MTQPRPLIWINGFPGVGKLTIAQELLKLFGPDDAVLIDNHQLIDPVAAHLSRDHEDYYPARRAERQKAFSRWVTNRDELGRLIIFTDFQSGNELGYSVAAEYQTAANESGRPFVPVYLSCDDSENLRRVNTAARIESGTTKLVDTQLLQHIRQQATVLAFNLPTELTLNVTHLTPGQAAQQLFQHILACEPG